MLIVFDLHLGLTIWLFEYIRRLGSYPAPVARLPLRKSDHWSPQPLQPDPEPDDCGRPLHHESRFHIIIKYRSHL